MSSLSDYVRGAVCTRAGKRVLKILFGWLLWYYWVSDKPARETPMGCTKFVIVAGVYGSTGMFH